MTDGTALELYAWNAKVSAAMVMPLHIIEIVLRNAISSAIAMSVQNDEWICDESFLNRLPAMQRKYLIEKRKKHHTVNKVIPELKFSFWEQMMTSRHDGRVWKKYLNDVFPNCDCSQTCEYNRKFIHDEIVIIRNLRNRIAHYEPIFYRNLIADYERIYDLVELCCLSTATWMDANQLVTEVIAERP